MRSFPPKRLSFIYVFGLKILTFNKERLPLNILLSNENEALDKNSNKNQAEKNTVLNQQKSKKQKQNKESIKTPNKQPNK